MIHVNQYQPPPAEWLGVWIERVEVSGSVPIITHFLNLSGSNPVDEKKTMGCRLLAVSVVMSSIPVINNFF